MDSAFCPLDSGNWTLDNEFWALGSGPGLRALDSGFWFLASRFWTPDSGLYPLDPGLRTLGAGYRTLDSRLGSGPRKKNMGIPKGEPTTRSRELCATDYYELDNGYPCQYVTDPQLNTTYQE